ncbi:MAG: GNAT family N-acetyltransferase [Desulfuromonadaceae bacterium]|nr:GNAT family N-acetyltransferase [Desulfuromonadaceae bacterium]MDD5106491.1 GNAT family N-acetyltransferase [Desulfuromonadaceae bacterium]
MLIILPLDIQQNRTAFDCNVRVLNDFLHKTARQHREKGLSNTFVLLDEANQCEILGFFTLSFLEIEAETVPREHFRNMPTSKRLPAAKLARVAVDKHHQGKGYGDLLVADAVKRVATTCRESGGVVGFFVDAKDESVKRFYLRFGFIPLQDAPLSLFLPLKSLLLAMDQALATR